MLGLSGRKEEPVGESSSFPRFPVTLDTAEWQLPLVANRRSGRRMSGRRELPDDQSEATIEKAYSTIYKYKCNLNRWALPRWKNVPALALRPPDVEDWLKDLKKIGEACGSARSTWFGIPKGIAVAGVSWKVRNLRCSGIRSPTSPPGASRCREKLP
jgi:hypothetical protein